MGSTLSRGLPFAILAAALYGSAPIAQAAASQRLAPASGAALKLTARLAQRPLWLLGLLCEIGGFAVEAYAFSVAPASMVAPLMACDMLIFMLLARLLLGERLARQGLIGIGAMVLGVGLLGLAFSGNAALGTAADADELWQFLVVGLLVAGAGVAIGNRTLRAHREALTAVAFGATAGLCYGLATVTTRQVGLTFDSSHPWRLLATPTPYVLAAFSVVAIVVTQQGLQASAVLTFPITSAVSALLPVIIGTTLLGDAVPDGFSGAAFVIALFAIAIGIGLLGRDRVRAERQLTTEPAEPQRQKANA